jgi:hypothetical protein
MVKKQRPYEPKTREFVKTFRTIVIKKTDSNPKGF